MKFQNFIFTLYFLIVFCQDTYIFGGNTVTIIINYKYGHILEEDVPKYLPIKFNIEIQQISSFFEHSLLLDSKGKVYSFGSNTVF
jgi:hypothetical protein